MPAGLPIVTEVFASQTLNIVRWLEFLGPDLAGNALKQSSVQGWTNRELVVHIGNCLDTLIDAQPAPIGTIPLTLAEYLGTYPNRAQEISDQTHLKAQEDLGELSLYVSTQLARALEAIATAGTNEDLVMQGKRGPISLGDLVTSRLFEVVVHALDLTSSLRGTVDMSGALNPLDRRAIRVVAQELLDIVIARGGYSLEVTNPELWVRLAAGRLPYNTDDLTRAIAPQFTAGGVPDLGKVLPIL